MAQDLSRAFFAGVLIAMVLSAIMSTIDSLLIVASSAVVRDYWQQTRHPEPSDEELMSLSRKVTIGLSLVAFAIGIMPYDEEKGVFWTIIFSWSGIAATFCSTMILSLVWSRFTALGAKCAMIAGFLCVPIFKFLVPPLLKGAGQQELDAYLSDLDVLLPSFLVGMGAELKG